MVPNQAHFMGGWLVFSNDANQKPIFQGQLPQAFLTILIFYQH